MVHSIGQFLEQRQLIPVQLIKNPIGTQRDSETQANLKLFRHDYLRTLKGKFWEQITK